MQLNVASSSLTNRCWCLYTVTSAERIADGSLQNLIQSLPSNSTLVLGLRDCTVFEISVDEGVRLELVELPLIISLSEARNKLLSHFPPTENSIVAFPDDDCWYPETFEIVIQNLLQQHDWLIGKVSYGHTVEKASQSHFVVPLSVELILRHTASAAIFIRSEIFGDFSFNAKLGLGAKYGSAEDLDLALRLFFRDSDGVYAPNVLINHPKRDRYDQYFAGSIAAMSCHTHKQPKLYFFIVRRLLSAIVRFLLLKISLRTLKLCFQSLGDRNGHS